MKVVTSIRFLEKNIESVSESGEVFQSPMKTGLIRVAADNICLSWL